VREEFLIPVEVASQTGMAVLTLQPATSSPLRTEGRRGNLRVGGVARGKREAVQLSAMGELDITPTHSRVIRMGFILLLLKLSQS
jgi:hypothetical protein